MQHPSLAGNVRWLEWSFRVSPWSKFEILCRARLGMRILAMVCFVRIAYSKIQALVMVENGIKIPGSSRFWPPNGKHWKPWKTSGSPKSTADSSLTKIWLLKHWPIKIGRKSKTAQLWMESLYAPLWPECLYAYTVGKEINACQANWQIRSSSHAEKRSCQSENWLSIRKKWFSYGA